MGWLDEIQGEAVGWDTIQLIYMVEEHPRYLYGGRPLLEAVDQGQTRIVRFTITLLEILVNPFRHGAKE